LEELELNWANPPSLEGLPFMPHLRRLEIARCRNLASLATLPELAPHLEHLHIQACGRVTSAMGEEILARLPMLRQAFVQDRWLIGPERPAA
jgi:hypothetical protein